MSINPAIFLDRDGVLIEDVDLLTNPGEMRILPGVPKSLITLKRAGFRLIMVSNQSVVARGMLSEEEVDAINEELDNALEKAAGIRLDAMYFCPHHPNATLLAYRQECKCRKPRPGLLLRAAREYCLDLKKSIMIGDRITDIIAGAAAGCQTILVQTGKHLAAPIETVDLLDNSIAPDYTCLSLDAATGWILWESS